MVDHDNPGVGRPAVGLVGAGTMGSRMADALRAAGHRVVVHDADAAVAGRERSAGSVVVDNPAAVAAAAPVVLLSLPGPADVVEVVTGADGILDAPPAVVVDMSTVDPTTTRRLADQTARRQVGYLDAPVLGRPARCGAWTLPVGGSAETLADVRDVLAVLACRIVYVGPSGSGNVVKLLNNLIFGAINAATVECVAMAEALGLGAATFVDLVVDSGAATVSGVFREVGPKAAASEFDPIFSVDLLAKDNRLALEMAEPTGLDLRVATAVDALNRRGQALGVGALDTSALVQAVHAVQDRTLSAGGS